MHWDSAHYCLWSDYMHWKQNTQLSNKISIWRPQTFVPLKRYKRRAGTLGSVLRSCLHHEVISWPWKTNIKACFRSCFAGLLLSSVSVSADTPDLVSWWNSLQKAILLIFSSDSDEYPHRTYALTSLKKFTYLWHCFFTTFHAFLN